MTACGMVVLGLSVKKTVCASSKGGATQCFEVARGPAAGTMVLARPKGAVQVAFVVLEDACARGKRLWVAIASSRVEIGFIAMRVKLIYGTVKLCEGVCSFERAGYPVVDEGSRPWYLLVVRQFLPSPIGGTRAAAYRPTRYLDLT